MSIRGAFNRQPCTLVSVEDGDSPAVEFGGAIVLIRTDEMTALLTEVLTESARY